MDLSACLIKLFQAEDVWLEPKMFLEAARLDKKVKAVLEQWVEAGYVEAKAQGKSKKLYRLGAGGRKWLQEQNPEHWLVLQQEKARLEQEKAQQSEAKLRDFLLLLKARQGKKGALTKAQLAEYAGCIDNCLQAKTIENVAENKYRLTAKAEVLLKSLQPPEEILRDLAASIHEIVPKLEQAGTAYHNAIQDLIREEPALDNFVKEQFQQIRARLSDSVGKLDNIRKNAEAARIASLEKARINQEIEAVKEGFHKDVEALTQKATQQQSEQKEWREERERRWQKETLRLEESQKQLRQEMKDLQTLHEELKKLLRAQGKIAPAPVQPDKGAPPTPRSRLLPIVVTPQPTAVKQPPKPTETVPQTGEKKPPAPAESVVPVSKEIVGKQETPAAQRELNLQEWQNVVYETYQNYCVQRPLLKGCVSLENLYALVQGKQSIPLEMFHNALLELEKREMLYLASDVGHEPLKNVLMAIRSARGLLSYVEPPHKLGCEDIVYDTAKDIVRKESRVSLPRLLQRVRELIPISDVQFEAAIRALQRSLTLEHAPSREDAGGICIAGEYFLYVTGVH